VSLARKRKLAERVSDVFLAATNGGVGGRGRHRQHHVRHAAARISATDVCRSPPSFRSGCARRRAPRRRRGPASRFRHWPDLLQGNEFRRSHPARLPHALTPVLPKRPYRLVHTRHSRPSAPGSSASWRTSVAYQAVAPADTGPPARSARIPAVLPDPLTHKHTQSSDSETPTRAPPSTRDKPSRPTPGPPALVTPLTARPSWRPRRRPAPRRAGRWRRDTLPATPMVAAAVAGTVPSRLTPHAVPSVRPTRTPPPQVYSCAHHQAAAELARTMPPAVGPLLCSPTASPGAVRRWFRAVGTAPAP
jgi:hypothetical protein